MNDSLYKIGIIGGMGSEATKHLFELVVAKTAAKTDKEHVPLMILNDPMIPDRTRYVFGEGESPLPRIQKNLEILKQHNVQAFAIPCVTAHLFSVTLKEQGLLFLDAVDETLKRLNHRIKDTFILLSTKGTTEADVFKRDVLDWEKTVQYPDADLQDFVNEAIYAIKSGDDKEGIARKLRERLQKEYPEETSFILGCSELSMLKESLKDFDTISVLDVLAETIVAYHQEIKGIQA